jgi:hypothetical protein
MTIETDKIFGTIDLDDGIYTDIDFDTYLQIRAFSNSAIGKLMKSPYHFKHDRLKDKENKDHFIVGDITDSILTGNKEIDDKYAVLPKEYFYQNKWRPWNAGSKTCEKEMEKIRLANPNKILVSDNLFQQAQDMASVVQNFDGAFELLKDAEFQITLIWTDIVTGVKCKARLDWKNSEAITDLKTSKDASSRAFTNALVNLNYGTQGALYQDGWETLTGEKLPFWFLVIEKVTNAIVKYCLREKTLIIGLGIAREAMLRYQNCMETGDFPGYPSGDIDYPRYFLKDNTDSNPTGLIEDIY